MFLAGHTDIHQPKEQKKEKKKSNYEHYCDEQEEATIRQRCHSSEQST